MGWHSHSERERTIYRTRKVYVPQISSGGGGGGNPGDAACGCAMCVVIGLVLLGVIGYLADSSGSSTEKGIGLALSFVCFGVVVVMIIAAIVEIVKGK